MNRITITLSTEEKKALFELSQRERRNPRNQAALIIRHELERLGLLPQKTIESTPTEAQHEQL